MEAATSDANPGPSIQTVSGRRLNPLAPDPTQIEIGDIAQALGNTCRFGGHCRSFYSVAQHSCLLAALLADEGAEPDVQLWALLHDASEAYLVDLPHPIKHRSELGRRFQEVEGPLQDAILARFGLSSDAPPRVKQIDRGLLAAEKAALVAETWEWPELAGVSAVDVEIDPWPPDRSAREFLARFEHLTRAAAADRPA